MSLTDTPVVEFDFDTWIANFPIFANVTPAQGQAWFNQAGLYFENAPCNWVIGAGCTLANFTLLMYMATSHIAWMLALRDANGNPSATGNPPTTLVGRISSATEGSVSVSSEWKDSGSPSEAWWLQTTYGAMFWQALAAYRTAVYMAKPTIVAGGAYSPYFPYLGGRRFRG